MSNDQPETLLLREIADEITNRPVFAPGGHAWVPALRLLCELDKRQAAEELTQKLGQLSQQDVNRRLHEGTKGTKGTKPSSLEQMFPMETYRVSIKKPNGTEKMGTMSWTHLFWFDRYVLTVKYDEGYTREYSLKKDNPIFPVNLEEGCYQVNFDRPTSWKQLFGCYTRECFVMQVKSRSGNSM